MRQGCSLLRWDKWEQIVYERLRTELGEAQWITGAPTEDCQACMGLQWCPWADIGISPTVDIGINTCLDERVDSAEEKGPAEVHTKELYPYGRLQIAASLVNVASINKMWSAKRFSGLHNFRFFRSRYCFKKIHNCLKVFSSYIHDVDVNHPLWHIRKVLDHFRRRMAISTHWSIADSESKPVIYLSSVSDSIFSRYKAHCNLRLTTNFSRPTLPLSSGPYNLHRNIELLHVHRSDLSSLTPSIFAKTVHPCNEVLTPSTGCVIAIDGSNRPTVK